ncbi:MAG TPA: SEC-C metal-binding domain-containing protein, partial [Thermoanaerobaculia bacterium]|nr:SEC-C metal-binding domain-containing protein [Thermoanaerobaculia bacterium]
DPLQEYKKESFELFQSMKDRVEDDIIQRLFRYEPVTEEQLLEQRRRQEQAAPKVQFSAPPKVEGPRPQVAAAQKQELKIGRNDPCPCGSGKKYKKCHGAAVTVG